MPTVDLSVDRNVILNFVDIAIVSRVVQAGCVGGSVCSALPDLVPSCGQGLRCGVLNR